jgi:branched-chain amino acid transport system substrate-binding protein
MKAKEKNQSFSLRKVVTGGAAAALLSVSPAPAFAANEVLKIGFVGVTSGPAAAWGISNVRCLQTRAKWINEEGGVKIGGTTYDIEIVTFDDQKDPKRAIQGMEKMAQEGIHYVVGPNVDDGAAAVRPVAEKNDIMYFPYAFPKSLYRKPASNAVLGMIANYQSGPTIYQYLKDRKGVKTVAFVAANESDPLSQRDGGVEAAEAIGLEVVAANDTYQNDTRDFTPVLTPIVQLDPDLLVLSGVSPGNAPLLIRSARELGYEGIISTETAQDSEQLREGAGDLANGFISVGGASTPKIRSKFMEEFIRRYKEDHGKYDDESNTKVYALEYIVETLKAHPDALDDVSVFKKAMDTFSAPNPFLKGDEELTYVGSTSFGQRRQISVPLVINEYHDGKFRTLFVGKVD